MIFLDLGWLHKKLDMVPDAIANSKFESMQYVEKIGLKVNIYFLIIVLDR